MSLRESTVIFEVAGQRCVGVVTHPGATEETGTVENACGVVMLVGGPQYRAGSHRHFVQLARALANRGYPVMRFDFRGMGDSEGEFEGFASTGVDIDAALDAFQQACPAVAQVVLWGLCDAASAALIYAGEIKSPDSRLAGLCLVNPWVRSACTEARATVRHYYLDRLRDPDFWRKLRRGRLQIGVSMREFWANFRRARAGQSASPTTAASFQARMARGFLSCEKPVLVVLSGEDQVAREFEDVLKSDSTWNGALQRKNVTWHAVEAADHTFSAASARASLEQQLLRWLPA